MISIIVIKIAFSACTTIQDTLASKEGESLQISIFTIRSNLFFQWGELNCCF